MIGPILLTFSALVLILTLALAREMRLRKALEALLRRILQTWRKNAPRK